MNSFFRHAYCGVIKKGRDLLLAWYHGSVPTRVHHAMGDFVTSWWLLILLLVPTRTCHCSQASSRVDQKQGSVICCFIATCVCCIVAHIAHWFTNHHAAYGL